MARDRSNAGYYVRSRVPDANAIEVPKTRSMEELCRKLNDMRTQDETGFLCDFKLICSDKTFNCHRAVLAARSDYFRTFFDRKEKDFKEHESDEMNLVEEGKYVGAFLSFAYGNWLTWDKEKDPKEVVELIRMADKYLVPDLKDICEKMLVNYALNAPLEDCKDIFG